MNNTSSRTSHENVQFSDASTDWQYSVDSMPDSTFAIADTHDADLGSFFSRPIKIASFAWTVEEIVPFFQDLNPWTAYFNNPRVINRINNFNLLRCKLCVKFVLNGNSFYYGRLIVSYTPLHTNDNLTRNRALVFEDIVEASQRPHLYLDPTTSQGGTMCLPFVYPFNALSIPNAWWTQMGELNIREMTPLKHANGATDSITVSVFVWAEDVSLAVPTSTDSSVLTPQMGTVDEYGDGPVSKPAAVVAKVAGALTSVPSIAPYARATQMAVGTVGRIASMFGYSRPIQLESSRPLHPSLFGNLANSNMPDESTKLTFDVKQELTVDPRTMGLGDTDEMTILSIAQRETFISSFMWSTSSPPETLLWNMRVTPAYWAVQPDSAEAHLTACAFAVMPFKYWRGSMIFRFQIVSSGFHKGRLRIVYDPYRQNGIEYNVSYNHIIDIANEKDFTIRVGWGSPYPMLQHDIPFQANVPYQTAPLPIAPTTSNGVISIYPVTELAVPNSIVNNDISINVFVSAGDDFEVYDPDPSFLNRFSLFPPPVEEELFTPQVGEAADQPKEAAPMLQEVDEQIAPNLSPQDNSNAVFFADPVISFRQCLKRYNWLCAFSPDDLANLNIRFRVSIPTFPLYRGPQSGALWIPAPGSGYTRYNYCRTTLMNYLTPAYVCRRGGIRWKFCRDDFVDTGAGLSYMSRAPDVVISAVETIADLNIASYTPDERSRFKVVNTNVLWSGASMQDSNFNTVVQAEYPYYRNTRFAFGKRAINLASANENEEYLIYNTYGKFATNSSPCVHALVAAAEDFTLSFFTGSPVWYFTPTFPNAFDGG